MLIGLAAGVLCLLFGLLLSTDFKGAATAFQRFRTMSWPVGPATRRRVVAESVKMDQIFVGPALLLLGALVIGFVLVKAL